MNPLLLSAAFRICLYHATDPGYEACPEIVAAYRQQQRQEDPVEQARIREAQLKAIDEALQDIRKSRP
jgi:hypothetical protein